MQNSLIPVVPASLTAMLERMAVSADAITADFAKRLGAAGALEPEESERTAALAELGARLAAAGVLDETIELVRELIHSLICGPMYVLDGATHSASTLRVLLLDEKGNAPHPEFAAAWLDHLTETERAD